MILEARRLLGLNAGQKGRTGADSVTLEVPEAEQGLNC